ncbi:MAG: hypothetical protein COV76_05315 [Candidatus Omnitrophica bacterium CG11_big_fil_rev_8_21_14_0_20_64_10]|nr:MAG: hypothetical protein COV76_05315 [Candidatus Omnitrophica bacterium CG11_big_fil_rev_8_21_14_0_20_64_10]
MGLYIIQRIIEQHGGTIKADSEYGVGTTFTIKLPASAPKVEVAAEASPESGES